MDALCADKRGTLTMNALALRGALAQPGFTEAAVVSVGAFGLE